MEMEVGSSTQIQAAGEKLSTAMYSRIVEALARTSVCVRNLGLYGRFHPVIDEMIGAAHNALTEALDAQPTITLVVSDSGFVANSFPIEDNAECLAYLANSLRERGANEVTFNCGITRDEVVEFGETLSLPSDDFALRGGIGMELRRRQIIHIVAKAHVLLTESREGRDPADIYEEAAILVEEAMRAVQSGLQIPVPEIRNVVSDSLHSLTGDESALLALAGIRSYDRYLSEHSVNVCILSMILSKDLGLDATATLELGISAMLHDVGKVFVPGDVVRKPGKLTEQEWEQIRRHPAEGARALAGLADLPALASTIALEHHIHCDGTGYPTLSSQHKPHLLSRLVAIVDTYDALTTDRPYRERWTAQRAIGWMLYESFGQYDRQLMARFASRANLHPIGALVRLRSGDLAIVVGGSYKHPAEPSVKIVAGLNAECSPIIDLSTNTATELAIDTMAQPVETLLPYTDKLAAA